MPSTSPKSSMVGTNLSIHDSKLIDLAARGYTFHDIAERVGADPVWVAQRIRQILDSVDQWSAVEMSKIIMLQMQDVLGFIKSRMENSPADAQWADATVKTLKTVSEHYMKMREITLKEVELLGHAQMRGMKMLFEAAYQPLREHLADYYPEVYLQQVDRIFIESLGRANNG